MKALMMKVFEIILVALAITAVVSALGWIWSDYEVWRRVFLTCVLFIAIFIFYFTSEYPEDNYGE